MQSEGSPLQPERVHTHTHTQQTGVPTACRCWVLVIRCNPMIMSDYDTLALTYRDTTVTPVIQGEGAREESPSQISTSPAWPCEFSAGEDAVEPFHCKG